MLDCLVGIVEDSEAACVAAALVDAVSVAVSEAVSVEGSVDKEVPGTTFQIKISMRTTLGLTSIQDLHMEE